MLMYCIYIKILMIFIFNFFYLQPKIELPEYGSDDDCSPKPEANTLPSGFLSLDSGMEVLPSYPSSYQGNHFTKCVYSEKIEIKN